MGRLSNLEAEFRQAAGRPSVEREDRVRRLVPLIVRLAHNISMTLVYLPSRNPAS
jgi:hypothetical protein